MRKIYAAALQFKADPVDALPKARAYARRWVSLPWGGWPSGHSPVEGSFTADDDSAVRWRTLEGDASRLWELQVDEPFVDDASMRQQTLLQIGHDYGSGFAYVQVSLRSTDGALTGGVIYENAAPDIVATLVAQVACVDGGRELSVCAWPITRSQEGAFAQLLSDPHRCLPVLLLVSDAAFSEQHATQVARSLAGLAHVAVVQRESLHKMVERMGLDIPDGVSAYLWWATTSVTSRRRPQWFRGDALAPSRWGVPAWPITRTIYGVAAFRLSPPALGNQLEADSTLRRIHALEERAKSPTADTELLKAWEADLVSLEQAQRVSADLALENERLQNDVNALLVEFDAAVAAASRASAERAKERELPTPTSLAEAVRMASGICTHLVFLPEAFRSAEAWQFPRPEVALDALHALDRLTRSWRDGELPGAFMVAARAAGLPWRPAISRTAQTQYRHDYTRRFGDEEIVLGPHLSWGTTPENALRIYLYLDRDTRTVVVGHVGRHLRDTSNPHL